MPTNPSRPVLTRCRSILITGAASGIGRACVRLFACQGWFVGCIDIDADALERLFAELGAGKALLLCLDITDRQALLRGIQQFSASTGGMLDLLFCNAGIDAKGRFENMTWETVLRVVDVNLVGALALIHAAIPLLRATPGSLCLSTSSASAIFGTAELAVYSATKHALKGLTEALSVELARDGVRAADIIPGIVDTDMLQEDQRAKLPKTGVLRLISPESVADTVWAAY